MALRHPTRHVLRLAILLLALGMGQTGCVSGMLARKIVEAPNRAGTAQAKNAARAALITATYAQEWKVAIDAPRAVIAVAVVEPGDYSLRYGMSVGALATPPRPMSVSIDWRPRAADEAAVVPRGTIVLLHGFLQTKESMLHWALFFAQQGHRAVLVDLRGHGDSSGEWISFGAAEARDLGRVMDQLAIRGLANEGVSVLGISYGAVMALHWGAADPRVKRVIALEPFSDPPRAIVEFARSFPGSRDLAARVSDRTFAAATVKASRLAKFSWDEVSVLAAVRKHRMPILFYHGARDTWIPPVHGEALVAAAPRGSRLVLLPPDDHLSLAARLDPIALEALAWIEAADFHPPDASAAAVEQTGR